MNVDRESREHAGPEMPAPPSTFPCASPQLDTETSTGSLPTLDERRHLRRGAEGNDRLEAFYEPCPQGDDCAGDGKHRRLFDCEQGCGFRGCAACMEVHESEPHTNDSDTSRERFRDVQR